MRLPVLWLCVCVGGGGPEKGQWLLLTFLSARMLSSSSHLTAGHFSSSLYATGASQAAMPVLELRESLE